MGMIVNNKTYGIVTASGTAWSTASNVVSVGTGENLHVMTVKAVDVGGDGGEIRLIAKSGTNSYYLDAFTIGANDSLDCSPLRPYNIESGWDVLWQSNGGADIHLTITGVLQSATE